jgi:cytochrome c oxidase cbb3-type subunit 3/ubiquinol-cytochrome c reductase cytochrome c subunit
MTTTSLLLIATTVLVALSAAGCRSRVDDAAPLVDGGALYGRYCALCHGARGEGYAADAAPQLAGAELLATASDAFLARAIARGRPGTTMSAWDRGHGGPLSTVEVDAVVAFVRAWQTKPSEDVSGVRVAGDATRGASVYAERCSSCHGAAGEGGPYLHVANAELLASASDGFLQYAIAHGRSGTPMASYVGELPQQSIDDLVALLRSWQKPVPPGDVPYPGAVGPVVQNPTGPDPGFIAGQRYTPADVVNAALGRGAAMAFVDARAPSDYVGGHLAGATNVPFYEIALYRDALPRDFWIVAYCGCPHAESGVVADDLLGHGFTKVTILDEGFFVWRDRGYPVTRGAAP